MTAPQAAPELSTASRPEAVSDAQLADAIPRTATILDGTPRKVCMTRAELHQFLASALAARAAPGLAMTDGEIEPAKLQQLAERIAASSCPEEASRLEISYAIARHLKLDGWPAAWEVNSNG